MTGQIDRILAEAVAHGLVDEAVISSVETAHRWPVMLITGLMIVLASVPIFWAIYLLIPYRVLTPHRAGIDLHIWGATIVACAVGLLRNPRLALYVQYVGASVLGSGIFLITVPIREPMTMAASGLLSLLATVLVPQPWLRVVLASAGTFQLIRSSSEIHDAYFGYPGSDWAGCNVGLLVWLFAHTVLQAFEKDGRYKQAAWLESIVIGTGVAIIAMLAYVSGTTFLAGGLLPGMQFGDMGSDGVQPIQAITSVFFALIAVAWMLTWDRIHDKRWLLAVAPVIMALSWFATSLGALSLAGAACLIYGRTKLAILAAVAALWTIGALYYAFEWPLLHKAALLFAAGVALLASTRMMIVAPQEAITVPLAQPEPDRPWTRWALIAPAVLVLTLTNVGIWKNEQVLSLGTTVFVELGPVDPRSLMQGDYMTLSVVLPPAENTDSPAPGFVVAQRDKHGIAVLTRFHDGESALAPGELLIQLSQRGGRPLFVTDAFFFKEGEGMRWAAARYGEFRVDRDGKAVLVGLRGPGLKEL